MDLSSADFVVGALSGILTGLVGLAATQYAREQNRLNAATVAADWLRDLRAWASEATDILTLAAYSCDIDSPEDDQSLQALAECQHKLSAQIDKGRFLLPNERPDEYGGHKPLAYRGYRHPALDALVAAVRVIGNRVELCSFPNRRTAIVGIRREFVSDIQAIMDPRSTNRTVARILRHAHENRDKDPTFGGLLPHPEKIPQGATRLLHVASERYAAESKIGRMRPSPRPDEKISQAT